MHNNLLCILGPTGSGKTRYLQTMERTLAASSGGKVLRIGAEALVSDMVAAIGLGLVGMDLFRRHYLRIDNLLIDNLWVLASRPAAAIEIGRLIRDRRHAGRMTAVASDLSPEEWGEKSRGLCDVLAGGERVELARGDHDRS
jgi:chromosomal replication initiation ATPase DnaA